MVTLVRRRVLAQLDPLLFIKRVPPTVIVVMDTSMRMLEDGSGNFYDPNFYKVSRRCRGDGGVPEHRHRDDEDLPADVHATCSTRRRRASTRPTRITATAAAWDPANPLTSNNAGDAAFLDPTRYNIAKRGVAAAVAENASSTYRWGLIQLRQKTPAWRVAPNCDKPVTVGAAAQAVYRDITPCNASGGAGNYAIYAPSVDRRKLRADDRAGRHGHGHAGRATPPPAS